MYSAWEVCLPVNNVGDTVEKDVVGEDNLCVVDVDRAIRENGNGQVVALERRHGDVAQRRRENDVVGDEVVLEDFLERGLVGSLEYGANVLEGCVGGHECGEVGDVEACLLGSIETEFDVEVGSFKRGVQGEVSSAVCEELEWGSEGEYGVDLVNGDALAQFDVLLE
jgi:hypothetical protein